MIGGIDINFIAGTHSALFFLSILDDFFLLVLFPSTIVGSPVVIRSAFCFHIVFNQILVGASYFCIIPASLTSVSCFHINSAISIQYCSQISFDLIFTLLTWV